MFKFDKMKRNEILERIGSELILLKNTAERQMKLFGHIVIRGGLERQLIEGKIGTLWGCAKNSGACKILGRE